MKFIKFASWLKVLSILSLICSFTPTAIAQNYHPSVAGNTWVLLSTDGAEQRTYTIEGPETVDGKEFLILKVAKETVGTDTVALDKSWILEEDGEITLHQVAFDRGTFGIAEATYDPPAINFPATLPLGYTWEIVTETVLKLVGASTVTSTLEVVAIEDVETPVGVFKDCVKVETNRKAVTALSVLRENEILWLAPDVGPVKFQDTNEIVFELQSYNLVEAPIATEAPAEETPTEEAPAEMPTEETVTEEPMVPGAYAFDLTLDPGLNMISIPLMPAEPYTAKSLAEKLDATVVIQLDAAAQSFMGYTVTDEADGFSIEGAKGYIVNTPTGGIAKFTGSAWDNQPEPEPIVEEPAAEEETVEAEVIEAATEEEAAEAEVTEETAEEEVAEEAAEAEVTEETAEEEVAEEAVEEAEEIAEEETADVEVAEEPAADAGDAAAAPALSTFKSAWAFIVTSDIQGMETGATYTLSAENLRTGTLAIQNITMGAKRSSAVWADLNRKSVIEAGDRLEIALYDDRGRVVSGPFQRTVTTTDIRNAFLSVDLRVGDVRPQRRFWHRTSRIRSTQRRGFRIS